MSQPTRPWLIALAKDAPPAPSCNACNVRKSCLADSLDADQTSRFEQLITVRRRVVRQEVLVSVDEPGASLFAVRVGQFKTVGMDQLGQLRVTGFHMPGDLIGLDALANGRHRFSAVALEDSEVCEIPFARLNQAMAELPDLMKNFHRRMSADIAGAVDGGMVLANLRADRRFAVFLLHLSKRYAALGYSPHEYQLRMSRMDIGSYLGINVESLSRMIANFRKKGWVDVSLRKVEIFQMPAIAHFSRGGDELKNQG
ncbi:MAG: cyclic nucleotide-binding domain-containing protein [Pseudomonadota bacterium]